MVGVAASSVQTIAKALGDPTRHRLFRYINDAHRPVYIGELAEWLGVNHNAVRQHLATLKEAKLVVEQIEKRSTPGRPRLSYAVDPNFSGSWGTKSPYQTVAILLAEVITSRRIAIEVGRDEGRRRARRVSGDRNLLRVLYEDLRGASFHPTPVDRGDEHDFILEQCPYAEVAAMNPKTVCQLHLGLLEGLATELDKRAIVNLVTRDPRIGGCRVEVRGLLID